MPLLEQVVGNVRATLAVLLASVGIVLLVACTNVANLLLSRALAREREIAVRAAMGASRLRIVRQLLTESVLLALLGGVLGIALASASVRAIQWLQPPGIPRLGDIAVDGQMLRFTLLLCVASGVLFGLAPAMGVGRLDLHGTLKDAGAVGRPHREQAVVVVLEAAAATHGHEPGIPDRGKDHASHGRAIAARGQGRRAAESTPRSAQGLRMPPLGPVIARDRGHPWVAQRP